MSQLAVPVTPMPTGPRLAGSSLMLAGKTASALEAAVGSPCWSARIRSSALGAPPKMARDMSIGAGEILLAATGHIALLSASDFALNSFDEAWAADGVSASAAIAMETGNHRDSPATRWAFVLMPIHLPWRHEDMLHGDS